MKIGRTYLVVPRIGRKPIFEFSVEGRDLLHGTSFGGDFRHLVFEPTDVNPGTGKTRFRGQSLGFFGPQVREGGMIRFDGGGDAPWSCPSTCREVKTNHPDGVT